MRKMQRETHDWGNILRIWAGLIIVVFLLMLFSGSMEAVANGDDDDSDDTTIDITTGGTDVDIVGGDQSVSIKGSKSLALAQSLGDVDIGRAAECIVTEQYGFVLWQRQYTEYDRWCLAAIIDRQGKPIQAAMMRCSDKETSDLYGKNCIEALTFGPAIAPTVVATPNQAVESNDDDELDEHHQQIKQLTDRLDKYESDRQAASRAYRSQQQVQQQQYEEVQEFQDQRQRKIDQIKEEFGDASD